MAWSPRCQPNAWLRSAANAQVPFKKKEGESNLLAKAPPTTEFPASLVRMCGSAPAGKWVSAWRKSRMPPDATDAPVFSCSARCGGKCRTIFAPNECAISRVWSVLPPSETMISSGLSRRTISNVAPRVSASLSVGMITDMLSESLLVDVETILSRRSHLKKEIGEGATLWKADSQNKRTDGE